MPKSKAKENLRTILDNLSNDEVSTAQRNAAGWMPSGIADSISRSLKSFHSSDESDKNDDASSDLEPESIYYDIENVLDPLGVSQRGESDKDHKDESEMYRHTGRPGDKGSPAAQNSNATYATPFRPDLNSRTTIQGVDNFAFENTEFRPPAVNRSTSLAPDYNDDDPPEDYGSSERLVKDPFSMPTNPNSSTKKVNFGFSLLPGGGHPGQTSNKYPNSHIPLNEMLGFSQGRSRLGRNSQTTTIVESDPSKVSDLSKLPELTLDTITRCIKERYFHDKIYTYCGEILISVNPFKPLELCTSIHYDEYRYSQISQTPHLYAISARAYSGIRDLEQDQVILVSGESGAGKTEATKLMVQHLMHIGGTEYDTLQDKIIKINPLLEAFGNAKTILNNNSSRFAKFLALSVNKEGKIESARVKDYMIERSRIVHHNPKERTFHAFYALLVGAPDDLLDSLYINRRDTFRITGEFYALNGKEKDLYKHIYQSQQDVFQLIKLTADEILDVNTILAAVLHLGNVEFVESENDCVSIKNETYVQQAAFLLQMDAMNLTKVLIERKGRLGKDRQVVPVIMSFSGSGESSLRTASRGKSYQSDLSSQNSPSLNDDEVSQSGEIILLSKNKKQAEDERDAIAKALYERMFGWLVRKVNDSLKSVKYRNLPSIGILDICGFENLEINSFEQLCINLVNEHLQNFMNKQAIEDERLLYVDEGIEISDVDVKGINNDAILSLFMERKAGILAMIDEDSKIEFSNDEKMVAKFKMLYGSSPIFVAATNDVPMFSIQHFAGKVPYDARSFIQKNRDTLSEDSVECLKTSESTLIQDLFTVTESITGSISLAQYNFRGSRRPNTKRPVFTEVNLSQSINQSRNVSLRQKFGDKPPSFKQGDRAKRNTHITYFKNSLDELLKSMKGAHPYFVRCIKPNDRQKPNDFSEERVKIQLQYNGVKEIARIRTFGFPFRLPKHDFELKFKDLAREYTGSQLSKAIFDQIGADPTTYKVGKTQIFMKEDVKGELEDLLSDLRRKEEEERLRKLEAERLMRQEQQKQKLEQERLQNINNDKLSKTPTEVPWDVIDGIIEISNASLSTIKEIPTPASNISDPVYNRSLFSSSSTGSGLGATATTFIGDEEDSDGDDEETLLKQSISDEDEEHQEKQNAAWDITQELTEEEERKDVHEQPALMVIKFVVYILLFIVLLGAFTCHKVSLMVLLQNLQKLENLEKLQKLVKLGPEELREFMRKNARKIVSVVFMVIVLCIPYALCWIMSIFKICFGTFKAPSLWTWIWVFIVENLHSVGMCLLVFRILPQMDVIRATMLLSGTALVPSILKLIMSQDVFHTVRATCLECQSDGLFIKCVRYLFDTLAMLIQFSVIPLFVIFDFHSVKGDPWLVTETVVALVLVSFSYWENFADGRLFCELSYENWFKNAVLKMRYELQIGRYYPHLITSLWKIGLTIWLGYQLNTDVTLDYISALQKMHVANDQLRSVSVIITLTLSAFVAFYTSFGACMFQMQIPSLSVPLLLASPAAVVVFVLECNYHFLISVTDTPTACENIGSLIEISGNWYHIIFGIGWWVSLMILTRHIWRPQVDRTANMERIFINPVYCGVLTVESILLNRRRHPCKVDQILKINDDGEVEAKNYKLRRIKKRKTDNGEDLDFEEGTGSDEELVSDETIESGTTETPRDEEPTVPMLFACATMWHETKTEMVQLLKSLHRLDRDQYIRRMANQRIKGGYDPDFYNFEAHIFFDDAMELDDNNERVPNRWVKDLVSCMDVACSSVHGKPMKVHPPTKVPTPYGGQLIWQMPGENLLFVHMKDMSKIRNRKRWSQVMYMYYLLGYRHIMACKNEVLEKMKTIDALRGGFGLNIQEINYLLGESASAKSQNTFLLALDGDTDFSPGSVKILLDRMRDENVGAACGRIHPIGNGPMIWYQKFEYAIGHWLQKAAEHVFGCVLCSPGCFSLFRAAALMDTNVMKKYTTEPTEPSHHLQFDQGEDRWLCTLLLQQGYRIEYAAAADAWTFAPEGFFEFFNQRRRWMPSTIANILDLLGSASMTTKKNPNMSILYILFQWLLMLMTILGPGTILMMIAGAVKLVFKMTLIESYLFATIPAMAFTVSCFWLTTRLQLIFAAILSIIYTFIMMVVFVGTIQTAAKENIFHPSVIVIVLLSGIFIIAGICHPKEIWCLIHGVLYLLTIPSGYLLLVIFSICNLNDVSWGTREVPTKAQRLEMERRKKEKEEEKKNKPKKGFLAKIFNRGEEHLKELTNLVKTLIPERNQQTNLVTGEMSDQTVINLLKRIEENLAKMVPNDGTLAQVVVEQPHGSKPQISRHSSDIHQTLPKTIDEPEVELPHGSKHQTSRQSSDIHQTLPKTIEEPEVKLPQRPVAEPALVAVKPAEPVSILKKRKKKQIVRDELRNPLWAEDRGLGNGVTIGANKKEIDFWQQFVTKYLLPIYPTPEEKKKTTDGLRDLRNSSAFGLIILNLLWMALNFMFQYTQAGRISFDYSFGGKTYQFEESILGFAFVALLLLLLILQMIGMLMHRMSTLQHLLAITEIRIRKGKRKDASVARNREDAIRQIKAVLQIPSMIDNGAFTTPPAIAEKNNKLGVTFIGASNKGSVGLGKVTNDERFTNELGKSLKHFGNIRNSSKEVVLDRRNKEILSSARQRMMGGTVKQKIDEIDPDLAKSFRPLLPPRGSKNNPPSFMQANNFGFTTKELHDANLSTLNLIDSSERARDFEGVGAMGRTLLQKTKIINEVADSFSTGSSSLHWTHSDVGGRKRPSYTRNNNFHSRSVRL